ncbi:MAG TPA: anti-sigma factor [Bacillus sp. (in: firmicutes)]|uniref:anti-sigma factor n=1 Tax=Bacillus litorisediminis TaxID=2922713 RepID=UPI001FAF6518|nr:anti-sigma factor [Bacillus litorisediminis]HWO75663.1 anti-sigma factor [Bacillus sp. (in: firmicutes)]
MACQHWSDEEMIDYILGKQSELKSLSIQRTISECNHCHTQFTEWCQTLPQDEVIQPSAHVKKRVMKSFKKEHAKTSRIPFVWKTAGVAAASFIALFLLWTDGSPKQSINQTANDSIFVMNDDTDLYELVPQVSHDLKGYAWINSRTKEMYLLVDGLNPMGNHDYQAWVKTRDDVHDAGLLKWIGNRGQLYIKSEPIERAEYIIISIEPKGGSRQPTDQDPYLIQLNAR